MLIGGYRLEEPIGAGGMASVFRARDEALGRSVALKILSPSATLDADFRQRFIRESQAASVVDHPNIIPIYGAGEDKSVLYLAMRYVSGGDLHSVVEREGALPPERALSLLAPVASALDAAHRAGIVHRDVKPANVLVDVNPGRPDHPYLSDFGLAKRDTAATMTDAGEFVGTTGFAAPEQIEGRTPQFASDQYAFACVAYILLAARMPFRSSSPAAVLWAQMSQPPPRVVPLRPDLPAVTDDVLARALAKNPDDRFPTCGDFVDALGRALAVPGPGGRHPSFPSSAPAEPAAPAADIPAPGTPSSQAQPPPAPPSSVKIPEGQSPVPRPVIPPPTTADPVPRRTRRSRGPLIAAAAAAAVVIAAGTVTGVTLLGTSGRGMGTLPGQSPAAAVSPTKIQTKLVASLRDPQGFGIVAAARSGERLIVLDQRNTAYTFSLQSGKVADTDALGGYGAGVPLLSLDGGTAAAPDNGCTAGGSASCAYRLFWFDTPGVPNGWDGSLLAGPGSSAATGDFTLAVSGLAGYGVRVLNLRTLGAPADLPDPEHRRVGAIALSQDGSTVAAVTSGTGETRQVCVWNTASPGAPSSISVPGKMGVPWESDGEEGGGTPVAVADSTLALSDGLTTNVYNLRSGNMLMSLTGALLGLSPDGKVFVTTDGGSLSAFDIRSAATGQILETLTGPGEQSNPSTVAFSSDGQSLTVGYGDGGVYVWQLEVKGG
jgi:serine/threonine protein kinase/WD40 repeat protein